MTTSKTFQATLVHSGNTLNWIIVRVPFDVGKTWGKRGNLRVRGSVNGYEFRTSLFPTGQGWHYLIVNGKMQKAARVRVGGTAKFELEPDATKRAVVVPAELKAIFRQSKRLEKFFNSFSASNRRWVCDWIGQPKSTASRARRADQFAERCLETIEAERELPPLIARALDATPKARHGWERMTALQRRQHLIGIFGYQSPDARQRRLDKAIDDALKHARKR
jgi:uncharacterized protein YdeI (YjbR/CyaY-like superfamily)